MKKLFAGLPQSGLGPIKNDKVIYTKKKSLSSSKALPTQGYNLSENDKSYLQANHS